LKAERVLRKIRSAQGTVDWFTVWFDDQFELVRAIRILT
jgi:hypothetical protein